MKKILSIIWIMALSFALSACSNVQTADMPTGESVSEPNNTVKEAVDTTDNMSLSEPDETEQSKEEAQMNESMENQETNVMGALSPEDALKYMQETENLVIVDVAATRWYNEEHFEGALNIPIEELDSDEEDALYMEIPEERPVIMHCRRGMIVPGAYSRVLELRPDIPEISYIDGVPLFAEYNEWLDDYKDDLSVRTFRAVKQKHCS